MIESVGVVQTGVMLAESWSAPPPPPQANAAGMAIAAKASRMRWLLEGREIMSPHWLNFKVNPRVAVRGKSGRAHPHTVCNANPARGTEYDIAGIT
jgi:hypothetical protein